jgi:hypothetical protein
MASTKSRVRIDTGVTAELARVLGARRAKQLGRVVKLTGLPAEVVLDLAIDLVDIASRKIASTSVERTAIGLGAARWRNVSQKDRSDAMRKAVQARWAKARAAKGGNE